MTEAIVALVVVLLAGCGYLALRYRSERGIESGISSFRRELRALAPRDDDASAERQQSPRIVRDPAGAAEPRDDADAGEAAEGAADGDGPAGTDR